MSPERAKIFFIEDRVFHIEKVTGFLKKKGHSVVLVANTFQDAEEKIQTLGDTEVNVVILDGTLSNTSDGEILAKMIKEKYPDMKVIGAALEDEIPGVDINSTKVEGPTKLIETVTNI